MNNIEFEQFLQRVVQVSQGMIDASVLESGELQGYLPESI